MTFFIYLAMFFFMKTGQIVEYIDQQKIILAIITGQQKGRLALLTENSRQVSCSEKRLSHIGSACLDINLSKFDIVNELKKIARNRQMLSQDINVPELWEILHEESGDIDMEAMTSFCFQPPLTSDHEAAVFRAFFKNNMYFKLANSLFTPYTPEQVERKKRQLQENRKKEQLLLEGAAWLSSMTNSKEPSLSLPRTEIIDILKDYYLFGKDAMEASLARQILKKSGLATPDLLFGIFVNAGVWNRDENIEKLRLGIPENFSEKVLAQAQVLARTHTEIYNDPKRTDLTHLPLITIDGQSTLDYDDAISLETTEQGYRLGIHIIDVSAYIQPDDPIDIAARNRGSSIYMPDDKIPMLPCVLSDELCSLKQDQLRPGISTMVEMNRFFEIVDVQVIPSVIKVHEQMSYGDANLHNGKADPVTTLYRIANQLREKRLKAGAVQITLPEVNVWIDDNGQIQYSKIDRENPSRMLVSEMMILANTLMAKFLCDHSMPGVFRCQAPPKQRIFTGIETGLMANFQQIKQLNRAEITTRAEPHSGLGVPAYVTATSPIRRYHDLLTQRQIKAALGMGEAYSPRKLEEILYMVSQPIANASRVQSSRKRYWLIKYLETMKGATFECLILDAQRDEYQVLIKELMLDVRMPRSGFHFQKGDVVQVGIQYADARRDLLSLFPA